MKRRASILLPVLLAAGAAVSAQANTNNQIDCKLAAILTLLRFRFGKA
jgi:hypothetical protein